MDPGPESRKKSVEAGIDPGPDNSGTEETGERAFNPDRWVVRKPELSGTGFPSRRRRKVPEDEDAEDYG